MSKAAVMARQAAREAAEYARMAIVLGCAAALILAGDFLPFSL